MSVSCLFLSRDACTYIYPLDSLPYINFPLKIKKGKTVSLAKVPKFSYLEFKLTCMRISSAWDHSLRKIWLLSCGLGDACHEWDFIAVRSLWLHLVSPSCIVGGHCLCGLWVKERGGCGGYRTAKIRGQPAPFCPQPEHCATCPCVNTGLSLPEWLR